MSTETEAKKAANAAGATEAESTELAAHIAALRDELQSLKNTVTSIANRQVSRAQDTAREKAMEAEEHIRNNPFQAVAIAAGLGFLFGIFTRR